LNHDLCSASLTAGRLSAGHLGQRRRQPCGSNPFDSDAASVLLEPARGGKRRGRSCEKDYRRRCANEGHWRKSKHGWSRGCRGQWTCKNTVNLSLAQRDPQTRKKVLVSNNHIPDNFSVQGRRTSLLNDFSRRPNRNFLLLKSRSFLHAISARATAGSPCRLALETAFNWHSTPFPWAFSFPLLLYSIYLSSGSPIQSASSSPTISSRTAFSLPPFAPGPTSTSPTTRRPFLPSRSSLAKSCTPRTCVSFPFWWFSQTRTCTTMHFNTAPLLSPSRPSVTGPTPSSDISTHPVGSPPVHSANSVRSYMPMPARKTIRVGV